MELSSILDVEFSPYKPLVHFDRLLGLAQGEPVSPVTLELDVSSACDHSCAWCVDPQGSHGRALMASEVARWILSDAREIGVKGVVFKGGGESLLNPCFPEILGDAASLGFEVGLVTNGSRLADPASCDAIARCCAYVRVSVDGPTPQSRVDIHGVDDLEDVCAGIRRLLAIRSAPRVPLVGATFCLDYSRRHLIEASVELGQDLALDYILIRPPFCEEVGFPAPHTPEQARELRRQIREVADAEQGGMLILAGSWVGDAELAHGEPAGGPSELARRDLGIRRSRWNGIEHTTGRCAACALTLVVTAELDVYGCCCLRSLAQYRLGTLDRERGLGLAEVLQSDSAREVLGRMRQAACLAHCTHPLTRINEIVEYLRLPHRRHSSFL